MHPVAITPRVQQGPMDCGVVVLEMYTGMGRLQVLDVAQHTAPHASRGLWQREMVRLARAAGVTLVPLRPPTAWIDHDCGFLLVRLVGGDRHWVLWFQGTILNPTDGLVWEPEAYLAKRKIVAAYIEKE